MAQCSSLTDEIADRANIILAEAEKMNKQLKETQNVSSGLRRELATTKRKLFTAEQEEKRVEATNKKLKEELNSSQELCQYFFDDVETSTPTDDAKDKEGATEGTPTDSQRPCQSLKKSQDQRQLQSKQINARKRSFNHDTTDTNKPPAKNAKKTTDTHKRIVTPSANNSTKETRSSVAPTAFFQEKSQDQRQLQSKQINARKRSFNHDTTDTNKPPAKNAKKTTDTHKRIVTPSANNSTKKTRSSVAPTAFFQETSSSIVKYFEDQCQKQENQQTHPKVPNPDIPRPLEQLTLKKCGRKINCKSRDAKRKQIRRLSKTTDQILMDKVKDSERKSKTRSERTLEVKQIDNVKISARIRKYRSERTPELKQNDNTKDSASKSKCRSERTLEVKQNDDIKDSGRKSKYRSERTLEVKHNDDIKDSGRKSKYRSERTLEVKQNDNVETRSRMSKYRSERTLEVKQNDDIKDSGRKSKYRSERTLEVKQNDNVETRSRMSKYRSERTLEVKQNDYIKDSGRKSKYRSERTLEVKQNDNVKSKSTMSKYRSERTLEVKQNDDIKDSGRKSKYRSERKLEVKQNDDIKDSGRKSKYRSERTLEVKQNDDIKDSGRKSKYRSGRTPEVKRKDNVKCTSRKHKSRAIRTYQQKIRDKTKDSQRKKKSRLRRDKELKDIICDFMKAIKKGPTFICTCCCRLLYRRSVITVDKAKYTKIAKSDLHKYFTEEKWICNTCHQKLRKGKIPCQAQGNSLQLKEIPPEIQNLYPLELQLIAKVLPFMKIVAMPRGAQHGIRGQVVLVPADLDKVTTSLPRPTSHSQIISLALKRRLSDKHNVHLQYIRPQFVNVALQFLKKNHMSYSDVSISSNWHQTSQEEDSDFWNAATETTNSQQDSVKDNAISDGALTDSDDELENNNPVDFNENLQNERTVNVDTCIYPVEGPDVHTNQILQLATGEGKIPISRRESQWEQMAFPKLFPDGKNTYNTSSKRQVKLTPSKYVNARLLSKDHRFAESPEYTFMALDWLERETIRQSISITTRKSFQEDITVGQLKNPQRVTKMLKENQLFATFKNIRGTPQYFKQMHLDMLAKLRQYGPYTFFITGSAAEFHWPEVISIIGKQYGETFTEDQISKMTWETKRMWLQRNPVTAARHIDYIFEQLWDKVILSGAHPVGQILNYDLRKEMQGRGTAHFHSAIHVKGAPKLNIDTDEVFTAFADKYITCQVPNKDEDKELYDLVMGRQCHHHTRTCKKRKGVACRFHYPRPPSPHTVLARVPDSEDAANLKTTSANVLGKMFDALKSITTETNSSYNDLLENAGISDELYQAALHVAFHRTNIIMQRSPADIFINNYNPVILKCLRSNMDIQIITSIWACIAYITSYICKPEKTMSELMQKASKESQEQGVADRLYHIGNQLRKGREVSHHEAIMRCLSIPFRRSNVPVTFISTDFKENRTRMFKKKALFDNMNDDDSDIYVSSIHDKYAARPNSLEQLPFADFVANYRNCSATYASQNQDEDLPEIDDEVTQNFIKLKDGKGKMYKRKTPQVIRYHYVSTEKDEEAYYHRLLLLYNPWRSEEKLKTHASYKLSFKHVEAELVPKIHLFEPYHEDVESALDNFDPDDLSPEVWEQFMAQIEQEKEDAVQHDPNYVYLDPESLPKETQNQHLRKPKNKNFSLTTTYQMPDNEFYKTVQSLNGKQRHLFDFTFNWATDIRLGNTTEPFYIFLSGEGGVGKSHLINALYQGVTRALRSPSQNPEQPTVLLTTLRSPSQNIEQPTVLLTASTGKAAVNINGTTLHSAFHLPIKDKTNTFEYRKPGAEVLNTLRAHYSNVKLIIADEISMFGAKSLLHLHQTLQHIYEEYEKPFAAISILAVGDLLQLNPVGDLPVFKNPSSGYGALAGSLWGQLFKLHELTENVRQKGDHVYADILSRVRTGTTTEQDIELLKELENTSTENFPDDTINLFLTNKQVSAYNEQQMNLLSDNITIKARDSKRETHTNTVPITINEDNIYKTGGLPSTLTVSRNAKAMITKNIDITDKLVNGTIGVIEEICITDSNPTKGVIYMKFSNKDVGREAKKNSPPHLKNCVPIRAITVSFLLTSKCPVQVERTMFPLVPAFAITAHKSQGSTYEYIVGDLTLPASMKSVMPGQTYTVLSRATSRSGLKLVNFSADKIKVNQSALNEMVRMRDDCSFNWTHPLNQLCSDKTLHIGYLNIRSLNLHASDLKSHSVLHALSAICLTETHVEMIQKEHNIQGFNLINKKTKHGLAIYIKHDSKECTIDVSDQLQMMTRLIDLTNATLFLAVTYRPPDMPKQLFFNLITNVLEKVPKDYSILIGGDFNLSPEDALVKKLCDQFNLTSCIHQPTHYHGNTLDLILTSTTCGQVYSGVFPLPYTDHFLTWVSLL